jgi:diguanylate cyclase (GGDEF)-like protein/PAS domain S-box-containing protein
LSNRAPSDSLRAIEEHRNRLARTRQNLGDTIAALRSQTVELVTAAGQLKRKYVDLQAEHPPVSLLLDNVRNLMFRRAFREGGERASRPPILLFYGDVGAILGPGHRQLSLQQWYRRVHSQDRAAYRAAEIGREHLGQAYTIEYRYKHALSEDYRWARETAAPPYDILSGRRVFDSYILDITEQKRAEEVVEDQTEYIRRFDRHRRLIFVNGALCRFLQKSRDELLGVDFLEVMPGMKPKVARQRLRSLTSAHPSVSYELQVALRDGTDRWQEWTDRAVFNEAGRVREYQSVGRDITERKRAEQQACYLAQHDPLTNLPNRALLEDHLRRALAQARRDHRRIAVLLLDLDGFKRVNDTLGHLIGDRLLCAVGDRLRHRSRASDVIARLGGDEFAVVQTAINEPHAASVLTRKLLDELARPFELGGDPMLLTASCGVALFPEHGDTPEGLIRAADLALYQSKEDGRGTFRLFAPEMEARASQRLTIERDLRAALERDEFVLFYQPRIDLRATRAIGLEALVRWRRPGHGIVLPGFFLSTAEAVGLGRKLDSWVIREACAQAALWRQSGFAPQVAVNVSAGQVNGPQLPSLLQQTFEQTMLTADRLELELTEHALIDVASEASIACLRRVAALGVSLAIDDFGSGFCSFAYLRHLPVQTIKIDSSFIGRIGHNRDDEIIIKSMIELSHALGKRVVAEGVETEQQLEFVRDQGCDEAQGFLLSPPLEAGEVSRLLLPPAALVQPAPDFRRSQRTKRSF